MKTNTRRSSASVRVADPAGWPDSILRPAIALAVLQLLLLFAVQHQLYIVSVRHGCPAKEVPVVTRTGDVNEIAELNRAKDAIKPAKEAQLRTLGWTGSMPVYRVGYNQLVGRL